MCFIFLVYNATGCVQNLLGCFFETRVCDLYMICTLFIPSFDGARISPCLLGNCLLQSDGQSSGCIFTRRS